MSKTSWSQEMKFLEHDGTTTIDSPYKMNSHWRSM